MKVLRPAGNKITTIARDSHSSLFLPFFSNFYQSGTAALASAIIAAHKFKPNIKQPEVIIPAYACPDLVSAIIHANATPVLVDLEPDSPYLALGKLAKAITENTVAIVAVRFFGIAERNQDLISICKKHNLIFIEDSAQGFPTSDYSAYWQGDYVIISFGRGKPVNLLGGGAVLSRNSNLMENLPKKLIKKISTSNYIKQIIKLTIYNYSIHPLFYGMISRLPGITLGETIYKPLASIEAISSFARSILEKNIETYQKRHLIQQDYNDFFKNQSNQLLVSLPLKLKHPNHSPLLRYPVLIKNLKHRTMVYEKLKHLGITLMYKKALHRIDGVDTLIKTSESGYPNATNLANHLITLPTHEDVTPKVKFEILEVLRSI